MLSAYRLTALTLLAGLMLSSLAQADYVTMPYLQNLRTEAITIMWERDDDLPAAVHYGPDDSYGNSVIAQKIDSGASTWIYRGELTGLQPGTTYHYRVTMDGSQHSDDRTFTTAPDSAASFRVAVWSDSQGTNRGAYSGDPFEPTKAMMRHMAAANVDFAVSVGDLAEDGNSYTDTRQYYLDRVAKYLGQTTPWFNAWGNHDKGGDAVIRKFADMPSKDRPGYTAGYGSFSFNYAGCHFICIDDASRTTDIADWLEDDLKSPANTEARFTFLFVHRPPYCELWTDGDDALRQTLVPLMEQYGVDICFSGHTHEYERGYKNGVYYCITGGGRWLDWGEPLVANWSHMTVGGHNDLPGYTHGLVNEYVELIVSEDQWTATVHAFPRTGHTMGKLTASRRATPRLWKCPDFRPLAPLCS